MFRFCIPSLFSCRRGKDWVFIAFFVLVTFLSSGPARVVLAADVVPAQVKRILYQVSKLYEHEDYARAGELLGKFRSRAGKYADHPEVLFAVANCCLAMQKYDCAVENYRKAVSIRPEHAASWQNMGNACYNMGEYEEAARSFSRAFDLQEKKNPELLYYSGVCYLLAEESSRSLKSFEKLFDAFPQNIRPEWKEGMARALISCGRNQSALPLLQQLVAAYTGERKKQWSEVLLYQYLELGMNDRARRLALNLAEHYPEEERWWRAAAHAALEQGRVEDALTAMMIISYLRPLDPDESRLLADMNMQADIPARALPLYEKILHTNPDPAVLKYLVYACRHLGQQEKGIKFLEKHKKTVRKHPDLLMLKADMLYESGKYESALQAYMRASASSGRHQGRAVLMAGYCALRLDNLKRALDLFTTAASYPHQKKRALESRRYILRVMKSQRSDFSVPVLSHLPHSLSGTA